jgi:resuscitation-promoting factor RpfB
MGRRRRVGLPAIDRRSYAAVALAGVLAVSGGTSTSCDPPAAESGGRTSTGHNQALGKRMAAVRGWHGRQWRCLDRLWTRESSWSSHAVNPSSGAYGIPQALGHGHPFALGDARAQIRWGLTYIHERYRTPCRAWAHETRKGWY